MNLLPASSLCTHCARRTLRSWRAVRTYSASVPLTATRHGRPFRVAVIGSGPAGFYATYRLLSKVDDAVVDMYEQLPVPFGLVRYGVAPDHPEVKNCEEKFTEVAASPRFNFIGNVSVGSQLPFESLKAHYDAILFSYGASQDRELGIPGEDACKNVLSARAFVGWYNGLPEYRDLKPDLTAGEHAVIVGQGNVALDVARILLSDVETLRKTDISEHALEALAKSRIKRVHVVGRRGPMQASFTIKEVRELLQLPSVAFEPIRKDLMPPEDVIATIPRAQKRLMQLLAKGSSTDASTAGKAWSLDFLLSPHSLHWSPVFPYRLSHTKFIRNEIASSDPFAPDAKVKPHFLSSGNPAEVNIPSNIFFRSIGYKSLPLPGFDSLGIQFDHRRGIIPNDGFGRVTSSTQAAENTKTPLDDEQISHLPGLYCAGWVKRGPTGVIASTMMDAFGTADSIAADWEAQKGRGDADISFLNSESGGSSGLGWDGVQAEAQQRGLLPTSWKDWQRIDAIERERGAERGKIREKFARVEDMLNAVR
ncbi:putative NADPH-adrenodoxin reductase Arh1 [Talaromyces proteolyticus]|uniref:NADPH:adrenodoxin oxidoreductase, mitochondrial n=1 Tax=Talaromyces proteolyticus TaxID=1131652 RepID=A0AAD4L2Y8_9EURO|nr:putative NADPH-adrenodoxin reductase Arh1 [Talaromyces proteolyticus]KAH8705651.1 putative NADPH-adrenodoxin reductase Arh1 [Talaromyces proteolyticus]